MTDAYFRAKAPRGRTLTNEFVVGAALNPGHGDLNASQSEVEAFSEDDCGTD